MTEKQCGDIYVPTACPKEPFYAAHFVKTNLSAENGDSSRSRPHTLVLRRHLSEPVTGNRQSADIPRRTRADCMPQKTNRSQDSRSFRPKKAVSPTFGFKTSEKPRYGAFPAYDRSVSVTTSSEVSRNRSEIHHNAARPTTV